MVILYRKAPKHHSFNFRRVSVAAASVFAVALVISLIRNSNKAVEALTSDYTNISEAYENYGFAYCFTNSILDTGISKPKDYSEESVAALTGSLRDEQNNVLSAQSDDAPNIIMIQLESFFDIDCVKDLKLSEDPIKNFHALQEEYTSGLLMVPTVGAGTVNTEFEVLTGIRQKDFGVSEYPYKTVLKSNTCESVAYDLKELGYGTHVVHNNEATFYGRNQVFSNLGFDTFTSMEYMNGITENPNGWVKDDVLTGEIIKTLNSTSGADFTFGITVQSHGKYDVEVEEDEQFIKVESAPEGKEAEYTYYVNQLYQVDQMIGDLVRKLKKRNEKTILVLYGDHLPSLGLTEDDLTNGNLYQTQYVIWNNFGLTETDNNMYSYQLYSYTLDKVGIHEGLITKYHQQSQWRSSLYKTGLTMLSYDLLYGDNYAYDGMNPFEPTELQMGTFTVKLKNVHPDVGCLIATGKGFTKYTQIYFNGKRLETEWIDSRHIRILDDIEYNEKLEKNVFTAQVADSDGVILSISRELDWSDTFLTY